MVVLFVGVVITAFAPLAVVLIAFKCIDYCIKRKIGPLRPRPKVIPLREAQERHNLNSRDW